MTPLESQNAGTRHFEKENSADPNLYGLPVVTIFGGGIAGLSTAHELIERGFVVQLVEAAQSKFGEYECDVGGLAANQYSRVPAAIKDLHGPGLKGYSAAERACLDALRGQKLFEAQPRFPLLETIRFDRETHGLPKPRAKQAASKKAGYRISGLEPDQATPANWIDYWDDYGTLNDTKLTRIFGQLRDAYNHYLREFRDKILQFANIKWTQFINEQHSVMAIREVLFVRITAYTDTDGTAEGNRALAEYWANQVRDELIRRNNAASPQSAIPSLEKRLKICVVGSANPKFSQSTELGRRRSNRVEFEIVEQLIPGEHGFRFFPNFYRHLFDTMRRTPLLDNKNDQTGRTAFDQLVATPGAMLALNDGKAPVDINLRRSQSLYSLDAAMKVFFDRLGFDKQDMLGLQFFTARWMTSCSLRRREEGEPQNFVQYIGGRESYSEGAWNFINKAPRALAAMSATESDARTQFDVAVQLMGLAPDQKNVADMTLNGPTNTAWLDYWKAYLKVQGVRFFTGSLEAMKVDEAGQEFLPEVSGPGNSALPQSEDPFVSYLDPIKVGGKGHRFVLAMSYQKVSKIVAAAHAEAMQRRLPFSGPFRQLLEFDRQSDRRNIAGELLPVKRCTETGAPLGEYPLRTISGLQFFFPNRYRIGAGNLYFPDSPWGLTSISQFAYWRNRIQPVGQYLGQISVDVGDWHEFYPNGAAAVEFGVKDKFSHGHCAWRSSTSEIAAKTWDQIKNGLQLGLSEVMAAPSFFHIDRNIVFYESKPSGYSGSLVMRAVAIEQDRIGATTGAEDVTYGFRLYRSFSSWSPYDSSSENEMKIEVTAVPGHGLVEVATLIVKEINDIHGLDGKLMAMGVVLADWESQNNADDLAGQIMISAYTPGTEFSIWVGPKSARAFILSIDGDLSRMTVTAPKSNDPTVAHEGILSFEPPLRDGARISDVRVWDNGLSVRFTLSFGDITHVSVANMDGLIEIIDGAALSARVDWHNIQQVRAPSRSSGVDVTTAVRGNAILSFSQSGIMTYGAPEPGRAYGVRFSIQDRVYEINRKADINETWIDLRAYFLEQLQKKAGDVVLAREKRHVPMLLMGTPSTQHLNTKQDQEPKLQLIVSPVVSVAKTTLTVAPYNRPPDVCGTFIVQIKDWILEHKSESATQEGLRDAILAEITQAIDTGKLVADRGQKLSATALAKTEIQIEQSSELNSQEPAKPFNIAVQHDGRMLELVGAPAMDIQCKEIDLFLPRTAYVPFRNDGEFLINRPNQWQYRPGLYDKKNKRFVSPSDPSPEDRVIHYGHLDCRPLRRWVGAGTYMATYTRMTTMEAANESGRHAVIALLHDLLVRPEDAVPDSPHVLPSSFPEIWDPEDMEPQDLIYFKDIDEELCKSGLPHVFDLIGLKRQVLAILSHRKDAKCIEEQIESSHAALMQGLKLNGVGLEIAKGVKDGIRIHLTLLRDALSAQKDTNPAIGMSHALLTYLLEQLEASKY